jgi:phage-related protein
VLDKLLAWLGTARRDVRAFPAVARRRRGFQLRRVQRGLDPEDWKPMPGIGPGVREIRIQTELQHRVFYVATFAEAVYVVHAFEKRTRKTPPQELKLVRDRYRALINESRADAKNK